MSRATVLLLLIVASVTSTRGWQQTPPAGALADIGLTYEGYYDVRTHGNDTSFSHGLTVRYVNGQQRFLSLTGGQQGGRLHEFVLPTTFGDLVTTPTRTWTLGSVVDLRSFQGIWWEQAKNRLWVTASDDYTNEFHNASVTLVSLNDNGSVAVIGRWELGRLPEKRVYGSCLPSPATPDKYACGNGGYTSLVEQAGGASMGPTLYEIPEPTSVANGGRLPVRTLLDARGDRGLRRTIAQNYFDGGDRRPNPPTPPTIPPDSRAGWLSPNRQGQGYMTWGDSYYNTGMLVPGLGYVAVASLCKGKCYYMSSNLEYDWRQFEIHVWPAASLTGRNPLTRPASMVEFTGPFGDGYVQDDGPNGSKKYKWGGNTPAGNISGATYDATAGRIYLAGYPLGRDIYTGRVWSLRVNAAGR